MAESTGKVTPTAENIQLAIRLGWSVAAVYGQIRTRKQLSLRAPDPRGSSEPLPRLSYSDRGFTVPERLWINARRILELSEILIGALPGVDQPQRIPDAVYRLPDRIRKYMADPHGVSLPDDESLYQVLQKWTLDIWIRFAAAPEPLALAFTLGGSLADTYWYMRSPERSHEGKSKESWHELLERQRLMDNLYRVRRLEEYLPPRVGLCLRHSLWEWGIARELERHDDKLHMAYPVLYRLRSLGPIGKWRASRMREHRKREGVETFVTLSEQEEHDLHNHLKEQSHIWENLIHGTRRPRQYLRASDWQMIRILALGTCVLIVVALVALLAYVVPGIIQFLDFLMRRSLIQIEFPTKLNKHLEYISALGTVLLFVATQIVRSFRDLARLYRAIREWFFERKLEQRTLVSWNRETKSFLVVCLEGVLFS